MLLTLPFTIQCMILKKNLRQQFFMCVNLTVPPHCHITKMCHTELERKTKELYQSHIVFLSILKCSPLDDAVDQYTQTETKQTCADTERAQDLSPGDAFTLKLKTCLVTISLITRGSLMLHLKYIELGYPHRYVFQYLQCMPCS